MIDTQLIMLEGLPSTGKSTNSDFLRMQLERNGKKVKWIHEVTRPQPTQFFSEACFSRDEYEMFLKAHPESAHVLDSIAVFRKNTVGIDLLEIEWNHADDISESVFDAIKQHDMWNCTLDKYKEAAIDKWEHFAETAMQDKGTIYILDSSIFQAQIFPFLWENAGYERLEIFVNKLCEIVKRMNPSLIYLYRENAEDTIDYLEKERGTQWLKNTWERDKSRPYYQGRSKSAEEFKQFLRDYANYAGLLFNSIDLGDCRKISVEISKSDWASYENKMLSFLEIENIQSPEFFPPNGVYRNEELSYEITVDGLMITDPDGNNKKLTPKTANEFYAECLPMILRFEDYEDFEDSERIIMTGTQINARWSTTGIVYKKSSK